MSETLSQTTVKINEFSFYRPRLVSVFAAIVLVSLLSLLFVWSRIHAINLEYNISSLECEIGIYQQQIKELKLEVAVLAQDGRIEGLAIKNLGFRAPLPGQIIRVE
jgi:cell division protein FtsL